MLCMKIMNTEVVEVPASSSTFVFTQSVAAADWVIAHNLNKFPSITVVDSAGTWVRGGAEYVDSNTIILHFSAPFSGTAYLN